MPRPLLTLTLFGLLASSSAWAQSPLVGAQMQNLQGNPPATQGTQPSDNVPLADYLALLQQISPAAEAGARDYFGAFARRCGRALMALIRANHLGDTVGRKQLVGQIRCPGKATR